MKPFTYADIVSWEPCYSPSRYLKEDWSGNALDILRIKEIPIKDKFWVVLRQDIIDEKTLRLFAVWCARQTQHLMKDQRLLTALDVVEKFATGQATIEEFWQARRDAANAAAAASASASAAYASAYAANAAASAAAYASASAYAAANAAAAAAASAAYASAYAAVGAAASAAYAAARVAQEKKLIEMLEGEK
jgi:hypothetical protein